MIFLRLNLFENFDCVFILVGEWDFKLLEREFIWNIEFAKGCIRVERVIAMTVCDCLLLFNFRKVQGSSLFYGFSLIDFFSYLIFCHFLCLRTVNLHLLSDFYVILALIELRVRVWLNFHQLGHILTHHETIKIVICRNW